MKLRLLALALLGLTVMSGQAWAWKDVWVVGDISAGNHAITAASTATSAGLDVYESYNFNAPLGEAAAMMPGEVATTNAAISARAQHRTNATQSRLDELRGSLRQEATVVDLSPKTIKKFFEDLRSGDLMAQLREQLENKWQSVQDEMAAKFSEEALNAAMENFIDDLLNCRTPQLDVLFPSINLDLGLAMCDYGQLFNNMKDQVNNIVDRGWGGQFKINGREARDFLKDPSLLKEAVKYVPPGQGHALIVDFLSDQSINASYQAKIDANAWAKQLADMDKTRTLKRMIKPRTIVDAQDDTTDAVSTTGAINNALAGQQLQNQTTQIQVEAMRYNEEKQKEQQELHQKMLERANDILGRAW